MNRQTNTLDKRQDLTPLFCSGVKNATQALGSYQDFGLTIHFTDSLVTISYTY